jgi:hypothetical protein
MMPHEDVDIPGLDVLVRPDDRMVSHLDRGIGGIGVFIHAGEHVNVGSRRLVVGVPFFVFDFEGAGDIFHDGVRGIFDVDFAGREGRDVLGEADATHEVGEPGPDRIAIKFAEEGGVMKPDPTAAGFHA